MNVLFTGEIKFNKDKINNQILKLTEKFEAVETQYKSFILVDVRESTVKIGIISSGVENIIKRPYYIKGVIRKRIPIVFRRQVGIFCGPFADPTISPFTSSVKASKFLGWLEIEGFTVVGILFNRDIPDALDQLKEICGI